MWRRGQDIVHAACDLAQGQPFQGSSTAPNDLHPFSWLLQARDVRATHGVLALWTLVHVIRILIKQNCSTALPFLAM